jgi:hypothetical protein
MHNLQNNSTLQLIHIDRPLLDYNGKNDEVVDHLSRILKKSNSLTDISLRYFNMHDFGAKLLADSLIINNSVQILNLECNNIGIHGVEAIASYLLLKPNNSLKRLFLSYNAILDDGAIALAEVFLKIPIKYNINYD